MDDDVTDLVNAIVIVIRPEEPAPVVRMFFRNEDDATRANRWLETQPALLEIVIKAVRLTGAYDDILDGLNEAAGTSPGDDDAWLELWRRHEPWKLPPDDA